jgi:hypothetical protein
MCCLIKFCAGRATPHIRQEKEATMVLSTLGNPSTISKKMEELNGDKRVTGKA